MAAVMAESVQLHQHRPAVIMEAQDCAVAVAISVGRKPPSDEIIWCFMFRSLGSAK